MKKKILKIKNLTMMMMMGKNILKTKILRRSKKNKNNRMIKIKINKKIMQLIKNKMNNRKMKYLNILTMLIKENLCLPMLKIVLCGS